jgi:hypothetical protein
MKTKYLEKIGNYTIIRFIADAAADSEAAKEKIASLITPEMNEEDVQRLYMENLVYAKVGQEAELIDDAEGDQIRQKLDTKGENRLLLDNGKFIADYRGVEYWINKKGKWKKETIDEIGVSLSTHAVLQKDLSGEQQEEIFLQQRAEQIAAMMPEEKEKARQSELDALADEADRLARRAQIQSQVFDPKTWYEERVKEVNAKYA